MSDYAEVWICCQATFDRPGIIAHLGEVHGLTALTGTRQLIRTEIVEGVYTDIYTVTIGEVALTLAVTEDKNGPTTQSTL